MNPLNKLREAMRKGGLQVRKLKGARQAVITFEHGAIIIENPVVLEIGGKLNIDGKQIVQGEVSGEEVV